MQCQLLYFLDDDDNESTSTQDDEEGDSSANILAYCGELVSAVLELKDSHGRVVCHLFKKLPPQGVSIISKIIVTHCLQRMDCVIASVYLQMKKSYCNKYFNELAC